MKTLGLVWLLFLCASGWMSASEPSNSDIQKQIKQSIVGKVVTIRNFYAGSNLDYRSDGTLKFASTEQGPWTVDGEMQAEKVDVNDRSIKIRGLRLAVTFPNKSLVPTYIRGKAVSIEVDREAGVDPMAAVRKVFIGGGDRLADVAPDYWKHFLKYREAHPQGGDPAEVAKTIIENTPGVELSTKQPQSVEAMKAARAAGANFFTTAADVNDEERKKVHRIGAGVSAPRAISTPDPNYNQEARQAQYQATSVLWLIVDTEGRPQNIQIARPAGFGLDEEAIAAVRKWLFEPAMMNGLSTTVQINVEVNFRLYKK